MDNNYGIIASSPSHYPVSWEVKNNCAFPVRMQWVDFGGKVNEDGFIVSPGETKKPGTTYVGHVFYVTNAENNDFHILLNVMGVKTEIDPDLSATEGNSSGTEVIREGGPTTQGGGGGKSLEPIEERQALTIEGSKYQLRGRVLTCSGKPAAGLLVNAFDKDLISKSDFLGSAITSENGGFDISFDRSAFADFFMDQKPDIYFEVTASGALILSTEESILYNADERTPPITLTLS